MTLEGAEGSGGRILVGTGLGLDLMDDRMAVVDCGSLGEGQARPLIICGLKWLQGDVGLKRAKHHAQRLFGGVRAGGLFGGVLCEICTIEFILKCYIILRLIFKKLDIIYSIMEWLLVSRNSLAQRYSLQAVHCKWPPK